MKKSFFSLFLVAALLLSACGGTKADSELDTETQEVTETETSSRADKWETKEPETETSVSTAEVIASHKDEYADTLYNVIVSLPAEKPESSLKQKDVDCDTLQWFNATYASFTYGYGWDYHLIGGHTDEYDYVDSYVTDGLSQSWGITDRASAIEVIARLASGGHVPSYVEVIEMMGSLGMLDGTEDDLRAFITEIAEAEGWSLEDSEATITFYVTMRNFHEACGENGIDAWDYCRIMQLCGSCYYAGFLTLEESLTIQLATAQVIQDQFDSWDAMNTSYLQGYSYWAYGTNYSSSRTWSYQQLCEEEDCPYTVLDFNMPLEKFW
ncbi:MAG: DUF1266 domain-containing protein [Roseburia sp.]|nr:DUF1266 domain-containing protein [Roseburia sp.]